MTPGSTTLFSLAMDRHGEWEGISWLIELMFEMAKLTILLVSYTTSPDAVDDKGLRHRQRQLHCEGHFEIHPSVADPNPP